MLLEDRWIDRTLDLRGSRYNPAGEWILLYNISRISSHLLASISTKFIKLANQRRACGVERNRIRPATYKPNPGGSNHRSSSRRIEAARKRVNNRPSSSLTPPSGRRAQNQHDGNGSERESPAKATGGRNLLHAGGRKRKPTPKTLH